MVVTVVVVLIVLHVNIIMEKTVIKISLHANRVMKTRVLHELIFFLLKISNTKRIYLVDLIVDILFCRIDDLAVVVFRQKRLSPNETFARHIYAYAHVL